MNTTISDAAVSAACMVVYSNYIGGKRDYRQQCDEEMRDALEAALPHLQPAKPEAVRLRDELRERAAFEAWANGRDLTRTRAGEYVSCWVQNDWETWQAAGAQQPKYITDAYELGFNDGNGVASVQPSPAGQGDVRRNAAYDAIDRFLRNNMDDVAYAVHEEHLETLFAALQPVGQESVAYVEFLDRQNDSLRRAIHAIMAKLAFLLDEDQFADLDAVALAAGVSPPVQAVDLGHVIDQIAQQWDGCSYDAVGETIDVGQAIRAAAKRLIDSGKAVQS